MANVLIESQTMTDIANAIREKNGTDTTYKPAEMSQAVRDIQSEDTGVGSRQWWLDVCKEKTNYSYMFMNCSNLTTIPQLDTSNGTNFGYMFMNCSNLTTIPQLDTSNGTNFNNMFMNCSNLTTIPQLDTSNGTSFNGMFTYCSALKNIYFVTECIKKSISFSICNKLTDESIQSIIDGLADLTGQTAQTITFHSTVKNKLTEEQIASATSKNWNIA